MSVLSRTRRLSALSLASAVLVTGCQSAHETSRDTSGAPPDRFARRLLTVDFDDLGSGPVEAAFNSAEGAVLDPVLAGAGALQVVQGPGGDGSALGFPRDGNIRDGARAALRVQTGGDHEFAPEEADFGYGADVFYDYLPVNSEDDNGDNVLQRGLFADVGQFKLQLDEGRPSCRVNGDDGELLAKATEPIKAGQWYRLRCQRSDGALSLFLAPLTGSAPAPGSAEEAELPWQSWRTEGDAGSVTVSDPPATLSIGGKLNAHGGVVEDAPDQFSGVLDNVTIGLTGE